jgi:hypothetical protein
MSGQRRKMKDIVKGKFGLYKPKPFELSARIGNLFTGEVDISGKHGYCYATIEGTNQVVEVINNLPSIYRYPVKIGYDPENMPKSLRVLSARNAWGPGSDMAMAGPANHHWTHEWSNYDTTFINSFQWLPGDFFPVVGALSVLVYPDIYLLNGVWFPIDIITSVSLAASVAALAANECRYSVIAVNSSGSFVVRDGAIKTGIANLEKTTDIPDPQLGDNPICAVRLFYGQTEFRHNSDITDFVDLRFSGGSTSFLTVAETDASPSVPNVTTILVPPGSLTDNGGGSVTINTGFGGVLEDITAQMTGGATHFTLSTTAQSIWVFLDGTMQFGVTFTPGGSSFDMDVAPYGTTLVVIKVFTTIPASGNNDYILVREEQPSGTYSGTFSSGSWKTRVINKIVSDVGNHCSLASNQISLEAGTYRYNIIAPATNCNTHQVILWNVSDSAIVPDAIGIPSFLASSNTGGHAHLMGTFTITATKALEVRHRCSSTWATDGFGVRANFGEVEVYTSAEFWKVA